MTDPRTPIPHWVLMWEELHFCLLVGGPLYGSVVALRLSSRPDGTVYAVRLSKSRPDHLEVYYGKLPFFGGTPPRMAFGGWRPKDLATAGRGAGA